MIKYRAITKEDTEYVKAIMGEYTLQFPHFIINLYPKRWCDFFDGLRESEYCVALDGNKIIGHAGYLFNNESDVCEIVGVVVSASYKRNGIGRELLDIICSRIRRRGYNKVILFTLGHPDNEGTLKFYKSIGYSKTNFEEDYFMQGYSRVTFEKELL